MQLVRLLWHRWLLIAKRIGNFQSQVIFSIFYLIFLSFIGLIFRFFLDPFSLKKKRKKTNFYNWEHSKEDIKKAHLPY